VNVLPVVALVLVVAELAGAVAFALGGSWLWAGVLGAGVVAAGLVLWWAWGRRRRPVVERFVERERVGW